MLKQRILTAVVLLFIVISAISSLSYFFFEVFLTLVMILAAWEWSAFAGIDKTFKKIGYIALLLLGLGIGRSLTDEVLFIVFGLNLLWCLLALISILVFPRYSGLWENQWFVALAGFFVLCSCWLAIMTLRAYDNYIFHILMLLGLVAAADIGAYFSGRRFGKRKLAPQVSPGKTWEGVWGGMLACCLLTFIAIVTTNTLVLTLPNIFGIGISGIVLASFSVVGDLTESMLKRIRGLKDSGNILPGHGGILDRIDGITTVAPLYVFLLIIFSGQLK